MNRRRFLLSTGAVTVFSALAGCASEASESTETPTPDPSPTIITGSGNYPTFSGTETISGDSDFWAFEFEMKDEFILSYTIANQKASEFDFDVFVFRPDEFAEYEAKIAGKSGSPNSIYKASEEGVQDTAEKSVKLNGGTYYLVVDNTDIGDAGDWGAEETRSVRIEIETDEVATPTATETPTESPTPEPTPAQLSEAQDKYLAYLMRRVKSPTVRGNIEVEFFTQADNQRELEIEIALVYGGYEKLVNEYDFIEDLECVVRKGYLGGEATFECKREWVGDEDIHEKVMDTFQVE